MTLPGVLPPNVTPAAPRVVRPTSRSNGSAPAQAAPAAAPMPPDRSNWYDVSDESSPMIGFIWDSGERELILPYISLSEIVRYGLRVTFKFGLIEVRAQFDQTFPLKEFLLNFSSQRVVTLHTLPNLVAFSIVRLDPENETEEPL